MKKKKIRPKRKALRNRKPKAPVAEKVMIRQTVLILDFGSQYTQLIARRVRENKVFSRIIPFNTPAKEIAAMNPKGLILS